MTPLSHVRTRSLATAAAAAATAGPTSTAARATASAFARKLDQGPSFDDFVGGDEIAQGTRVTMGNLKT
jgi:hypothetical protein